MSRRASDRFVNLLNQFLESQQACCEAKGRFPEFTSPCLVGSPLAKAKYLAVKKDSSLKVNVQV